MINAQQELIKEVTATGASIKCALLRRESWTENGKQFVLKDRWTPEQLTEFLNSLNFTYDNGFGGQELFGTVWLNDGTWLERDEYDGSEWWEHSKCPEIPEELK